MTEPAPVKRIVVALEPSAHAQAALAAAAELAARLDAELVGVYVEDTDLLKMAGLPFAREFSLSGREPRALDSRAMERTLRAQAATVEKALAAAAARAHARHRFRVARGRVAVELLSAGEDADMIFVGKTSTAAKRSARCGSTARAVLAQYKRTVVVFQRAAQFGPAVAAVFDGSPSSARALVTAAGLAHRDHGNIVALIPAGPAAAGELEAAAERALSALDLRPRCVRLAGADLRALVEGMKSTDCRALVVGAEADLLRGDGVDAVLESVDCPVVIVR